MAQVATRASPATPRKANRAVTGVLLAAMAAAPAPVVRGIDHMPVAVADLDTATRDFERLGLVMKPGRPHDDGIRNRHAKFPNGGGIELITAATPTSELARGYVAWLAGGDGPAWLALFAPTQPARFPPPTRLFFGQRFPSPTDGPRWHAHPNTAEQLTGAWLAGAAADYDRLTALGAVPAPFPGCAPFARRGRALRLPDGELLVFLPADGRPPARALRGATVRVRDLGATRRWLRANGVAVTVPRGCAGRALWVHSHGLWLQFARPA